MDMTEIILWDSDNNEVDTFQKYMEFHPDFLIWEEEVYQLFISDVGRLIYKYAGSSIWIQ